MLAAPNAPTANQPINSNNFSANGNIGIKAGKASGLGQTTNTAMQNTPFKTFILAAVLLAATVSAQAAPSKITALMPRADDYTLMWWADGFPTRVTPWDLAAEKDSTLRCYTTETTEEQLRPRYRVVRQGIIEFKEAGAQTLTLRPAWTRRNRTGRWRWPAPGASSASMTAHLPIRIQST